MRRWLDWAFRSRKTGRITIGQPPNLALILFLGLAATYWLAGPSTSAGSAAGTASRLVLAIWAADELLRGVNPWRRCLGSAVLAWLAASALG